MALLHADEVPTSVTLVERLVAEQFPEWSHLPVTRVTEFGTDHALYRIGEDLVARLPIIAWAVDQVESDRRWLPALAPYLPVSVPEPLAVGAPGHGYPWPWLVVPWLPGQTPTDANTDWLGLADDLAAFVTALRSVDPSGGPLKTDGARGVPLATIDADVREWIPRLDGLDQAQVLAAWEDAVSAQPWEGPPTWMHADLMAGNLLVRHQRLTAVIDFGGLGLGDPAPDLIAAWVLFAGAARERFRDAVRADEAMWRRGRGWALAPAITGTTYYAETVPAFSDRSRRTIEAIVADFG